MAENWWPYGLTEAETLAELEYIRNTGTHKWHPTEDRTEVVFEHGLVDRDFELDPPWWLTTEGNKRLGASHRKRGPTAGTGKAGRHKATKKKATKKKVKKALTRAEFDEVRGVVASQAANMVDDGAYSSVADAWDSAADTVEDSLRTQTLAEWMEDTYVSISDTWTKADVTKAIGLPTYKAYLESISGAPAKKKATTPAEKRKLTASTETGKRESRIGKKKKKKKTKKTPSCSDLPSLSELDRLACLKAASRGPHQ